MVIEKAIPIDAQATERLKPSLRSAALQAHYLQPEGLCWSGQL
jgi:hypothetical protein